MLRTPTDSFTVVPTTGAQGRVRVPGDKSISHRYAMLAAIADGESTISGFSPGADCAATLACLRGLGVAMQRPAEATIVIAGRGVGGLRVPSAPLDALNSGTPMRLLSGIVAGRTRVVEMIPTRDHTERALEAFGVTVVRDQSGIELEGGQRLRAQRLTVPGDSSGAAVWASLAGGTPGSSIEIDGVGLNLSRISVLDVYRRAGVQVEVSEAHESAGERAGGGRFLFGASESFSVESWEVPLVIDEI